MSSGNKTKIDPPEVVDPQKQFKAAINAEIGALQKRLAAEQQFRPQFDRIQIQSLQEFAPQLAKLSNQLTKRELGLQEQLNPEAFAARRALGQRIAGLGQGMNPLLEAAFRRQFAAQEGQAGRLGSPVGSATIARQLAIASAQQDNQLAQEALGLAGQIPTLGGFGSGGLTQQLNALGGGPGLTGSFVGQQLGLGGQLAGVQANQFGTRVGAETARRGQNLTFASDLIGGGLAAGGQLGSAAILTSDRRIKTNIKRVGYTDQGLPIYTFKFKGNTQLQMGVMAQDVEKVNPEAVIEIDGIKHVNYNEVA